MRNTREEAAKLAAELTRELVTELVACLEDEIVALVVNRLATLGRESESGPEFYTGLEIVPDKKAQH